LTETNLLLSFNSLTQRDVLYKNRVPLVRGLTSVPTKVKVYLPVRGFTS